MVSFNGKRGTKHWTLATLKTFWTFLGALCGSHERRLLNDLNINYNKYERPVADESEALEIKFGLALQQILDVVSFVWVNLW